MSETVARQDEGTIPAEGRAPAGAEAALAAAEPGHGRAACSPAQFGRIAWKDVLVRTYNEVMEDRITTIGGGIAFYSLLALFPAVAALVSLYGLAADIKTISSHLAALAFLLPPNAFSIVEDQIARILAQGEAQLGLKFAFGLAISIWSANAGMRAMIDGLNVAYEEQEKRSYLRVTLLSLGLTAATLIVLLAVIGLSTVLPQLFDADPATQSSLALARWPVVLVLLAVGLAVLYRYGPSRTEPRWRWVSYGSLFAVLMIMAISAALSWYMTNLTDYNKTYGSLGAAVALMTWMWLSACAVLVGAELNAELEHQTARDSTVGPDKPLGRRGATMADTIGARDE